MEPPWAEQLAPEPSSPEPSAPEPTAPQAPVPDPRPAEPEPRSVLETFDDGLPTDFDNPRPEYAPEPPRKGISVTALVLSCLVVGALAAGGGYMIGRKQSEASRVASQGKDQEPAPLRAAVPLKTWLPPRGKKTPDTAAASPTVAGPTSVLKAFLTAPGWAARSAHVIASEQVHQSMAVQASIHGDGPIDTTEISLLQDGENSHVFLVKTEKIPGGFPVALARTGDGWLVDWRTFSEFFYDRFKAFAAEPSGKPETFHLLVNRGEAGADENTATFRLNPPMPGREQLAKVRKDSSAYATLVEVFEQQEELDPDTFRELTAAQGLPLVVVLSSRGNGNGGTSLWIDDVIAVGWGPQIAE
jgi:hypothetical protein